MLMSRRRCCQKCTCDLQTFDLSVTDGELDEFIAIDPEGFGFPALQPYPQVVTNGIWVSKRDIHCGSGNFEMGLAGLVNVLSQVADGITYRVMARVNMVDDATVGNFYFADYTKMTDGGWLITLGVSILGAETVLCRDFGFGDAQTNTSGTQYTSRLKLGGTAANADGGTAKTRITQFNTPEAAIENWIHFDDHDIAIGSGSINVGGGIDVAFNREAKMRVQGSPLDNPWSDYDVANDTDYLLHARPFNNVPDSFLGALSGASFYLNDAPAIERSLIVGKRIGFAISGYSGTPGPMVPSLQFRNTLSLTLRNCEPYIPSLQLHAMAGTEWDTTTDFDPATKTWRAPAGFGEEDYTFLGSGDWGTDVGFFSQTWERYHFYETGLYTRPPSLINPNPQPQRSYIRVREFLTARMPNTKQHELRRVISYSITWGHTTDEDNPPARTVAELLAQTTGWAGGDSSAVGSIDDIHPIHVGDTLFPVNITADTTAQSVGTQNITNLTGHTANFAQQVGGGDPPLLPPL